MRKTKHLIYTKVSRRVSAGNRHGEPTVRHNGIPALVTAIVHIRRCAVERLSCTHIYMTHNTHRHIVLVTMAIQCFEVHLCKNISKHNVDVYIHHLYNLHALDLISL